MNYILIGIIFMFCVEYALNTKYIKKRLNVNYGLGWLERTLGILFWPICLGIFLYSFFKELFK
jgi:putative effector of murein hydrolase LrgA (UPF0299 family)